MFRGIVKSVCGVGVLLNWVSVVGDIHGMEMMKSSAESVVEITERGQFLEMTQGQVQGVKSIGFENQNIDEEFLAHWYTMFSGINFNTVVFNSCRFVDASSFSILNDVTIVSLSVVNCNIKANEAEKILSCICTDVVSNVDLSDNMLSEDEILFEQVLKSVIYGRMFLDTLNLSGNNFSTNFIKQILDYQNRNSDRSIREIIF
jgi:hypothetical protein